MQATLGDSQHSRPLPTPKGGYMKRATEQVDNWFAPTFTPEQCLMCTLTGRLATTADPIESSGFGAPAPAANYTSLNWITSSSVTSSLAQSRQNAASYRKRLAKSVSNPVPLGADHVVPIVDLDTLGAHDAGGGDDSSPRSAAPAAPDAAAGAAGPRAGRRVVIVEPPKPKLPSVDDTLWQLAVKFVDAHVKLRSRASQWGTQLVIEGLEPEPLALSTARMSLHASTTADVDLDEPSAAMAVADLTAQEMSGPEAYAAACVYRGTPCIRSVAAKMQQAHDSFIAAQEAMNPAITTQSTSGRPATIAVAAVSDDGVPVIELDLSGTYCGPVGILPLVSALRYTDYITRLVLRSCGLDNAATVLLAGVLCEGRHQLEHLDVSMNMNLAMRGGFALLSVAQCCTTVVSLCTDGTSIRGATRRTIERHLATNRQIQLNQRLQQQQQQSAASPNVNAAARPHHHSTTSMMTSTTRMAGRTSVSHHPAMYLLEATESTGDTLFDLLLPVGAKS